MDQVLVPVDGSEEAQHACELACELFPESQLVFLHVIDPAEAGFSAEATLPSFPDSWYEKEQADADALFDELEALTSGYDIDVERRMDLGKPADTIVEHADDMDHIVMGTTGRQGVSRLLLGSVAEAVVRRSSVPVTVAR